MKVNVIAAIIKNKDKYLITQRPKTGMFKNKWEFPGVRVKKSGTEADMLLEEVKKRLNLDIALVNQLVVTNYKHSLASVAITFVECELLSTQDELSLKDYQNALWVNREDLPNYDWVDADLEVIEILRK